MFELTVLTVFPAAVAFAGAMDFFTMTIPNRVSLAMVVGFLVLAPIAGLGIEDVVRHVGAGLFVLVLGMLLFIPGWIGGGDAKLAAAIALWLGFDSLLGYLLYVVVAGANLAVAFIVLRGYPLPAFVCTQPWAVRLHDHRTGMPYGVALAAGALLVYPQTTWFASAVG